MRKNYKRYRKSRLYIILVLLVLLITSIGYAVFTEELDINGTMSGSANFKVYFTEATVTDSSKGTAIINDDEDTVTFTANLSYPGDKVLIGTKIKNESSMAVKLNDFTIKKLDGTSKVDIDNSADIKIDYETLDPATEVLDVNEVCDYRFVIYWDSYENQTVTNPESQTFEITLNYEQNTVSPELEKVHTHASIPSGGGEEPPVELAIWTQNGTSVTKGDVTLEVGQAVTGYEASGVTNWYVLGAEDGNLLITTITAPEKVTISGLSGCANGISILNEAAAKYNDGNLASSARSINLDDINRVTGYNPEIAQVPSGDVSDYGNVVTYYWDGTDQIYYSSTNDSNGYLPEEYNTDFYSIEGNEVIHSTKSTTATIENKEMISKLTCNSYYYNGAEYLANDSLAYTLLFSYTNWWEETYFLATKVVQCTSGWVDFGINIILDGWVNESFISEANGAEFVDADRGMRPVVTLKSSVNVTSEGVISNN